MVNYSKLFLVALAVCFLGMGLLLPTEASTAEVLANNLVMTRPICNGSMAECLEGDELDGLDEFMLDSETNRRILATTSKFISYSALNKNKVPCSRRGASYYNCKPGAQANPYSRGCSKITRCRRA